MQARQADDHEAANTDGTRRPSDLEREEKGGSLRSGQGIGDPIGLPSLAELPSGSSAEHAATNLHESAFEANLVHPSARVLTPAQFTMALDEARDAHAACALARLLGDVTQHRASRAAPGTDFDATRLDQQLAVLLLALARHCRKDTGHAAGPEAPHRNAAAPLILATAIVDAVAQAGLAALVAMFAP